MEQQKIDRINALARKAKDGLTPAEVSEREALRGEYRAAVRQSLVQNLDNTYFVDDHGQQQKLRKKGEL